jgi:hypothetical protein
MLAHEERNDGCAQVEEYSRANARRPDVRG